MLYPLKFKPILKEKIWGGTKLVSKLNKFSETESNIGESWELSGVPGFVSEVSDGALKGESLTNLVKKYKNLLAGGKVYRKFGDNFPVLIKFIDAADDLSVQVHPDDFYAKKNHNSEGKSELWYIIDAEKDAELILGVKNLLTKDKLRELLKNGKLEDELNTVKIKKGDVFFIPAGRIHAIRKGVLLAEIQQTSDITYRLYDWNRKGLDGKPRDLHVEDALKVADLMPREEYSSYYEKVKNVFSECEKNEFFTVNVLNFDKTVTKNYKNIDSFIIIICVSGEFDIRYDDNNSPVKVKTGETVLIPAFLNNIDFVPKKESIFLEVYM